MTISNFKASLYEGRELDSSLAIKKISAILCAILPLFLTAYTGLNRIYVFDLSPEAMSILVAFLTGAIGAISPIITSKDLGLKPDQTL